MKKDSVKVLRYTLPQQPKKKSAPVKTQKKGGTVKDDDDKVYSVSSVMPQYEGGHTSFDELFGNKHEISRRSAEKETGRARHREFCCRKRWIIIGF